MLKIPPLILEHLSGSSGNLRQSRLPGRVAHQTETERLRGQFQQVFLAATEATENIED
jgi:hypothetical protein